MHLTAPVRRSRLTEQGSSLIISLFSVAVLLTLGGYAMRLSAQRSRLFLKLRPGSGPTTSQNPAWTSPARP
jgi:hypothetical protein